jgi:maleylacetoacetate isomerase
MKLFTFWRSSAAYRVRIALNVKGVTAEHVPVKFRAGEHRSTGYLELNPQGLVPALETGGRVLGQSLAIIEYLDECHPEPPLLPRAALDRAQVRSIALSIACDIHPLNNLRVLKYLRDPLAQDEAAVDRWYQHWIATGFASLEQQARTHSSAGRHVFGDSVSLADVCFLPQHYNAVRFECSLDPYPTLRAIAAHLQGLPAFAAAAPAQQPDADPREA